MSEYIKKIRTSDGDKQIDYTALANLPTINGEPVVGDRQIGPAFSNALKGYASGEAVTLEDVSPIEHTATVRVHGKNLLDLSRVEYRDCSYNSSINGITSDTEDSYYCALWARYMNDFLISNRGKTLTFSTTSSTASDKVIGIVIYGTRLNGTMLQEANSVKGKSSVSIKIADDFMTITAIELRLNRDANKTFTDSTSTFANLQLELNSATTEYEPYIDPSTVILTGCGKNLWSLGNVEFVKNNSFTLTNKLQKGKTYTISANIVSTDTNATTCLIMYKTSAGYIAIGQMMRGVRQALTFTPTEETKVLSFYASDTAPNSEGDTATFNNVQIEFGPTSTEYEAYKGGVYTPNADGTCDIVPVYPTMTLLTDTDGTTIECEYNRDINILTKTVPLIDRTTGIPYYLYVSDGKLLIEEREV